jgi:comEA protein
MIFLKKSTAFIMLTFIVVVFSAFEYSKFAENSKILFAQDRKLYYDTVENEKDFYSRSDDKQLVNINTSDLHSLETLEGIGETTAEAIIDYRNEHGGFASLDEIMNVKGVGKGKFEKIKDRISIAD